MGLVTSCLRSRTCEDPPTSAKQEVKPPQHGPVPQNKMRKVTCWSTDETNSEPPFASITAGHAGHHSLQTKRHRLGNSRRAARHAFPARLALLTTRGAVSQCAPIPQRPELPSSAATETHAPACSLPSPTSQTAQLPPASPQLPSSVSPLSLPCSTLQSHASPSSRSSMPETHSTIPCNPRTSLPAGPSRTQSSASSVSRPDACESRPAESCTSHSLPASAQAADVQPLAFGAAAAQGRRSYMEDAHCAKGCLGASLYGSNLPARSGLFAVFDGHCSADAACLARDNLEKNVCANGPVAQHPVISLYRAMGLTEAQLLTEFQRREVAAPGASALGGTTALTALVLGDMLYVANVGDCRAVMCRRGADGAGNPLALSYDHSPESEADRIAKAGVKVFDGRLNGELEVARSLGDFDFPELKRPSGPPGALIPNADVLGVKLQELDEFAILASDGFWKKMNNKDAVATARRHLRRDNNPQRCAQQLVDNVLARGTDDNVTVIVVMLSTIPALPRPGGSRLFRKPTAAPAVASDAKLAPAQAALGHSDSASSLTSMPGSPAGKPGAEGGLTVMPIAIAASC